MTPTDKYAERAREIRRKHLPWDEYHYLAGPGGVSDQIEKAISCAMELAALEATVTTLSDACTHGGLWRSTELNKARARLDEQRAIEYVAWKRLSELRPKQEKE